MNKVGVELNTASAPLLSRVSGIGATLAKRIVAHRKAHGAFASRRELLEVSRARCRSTFEQARASCASAAATHPLDASAVHPERYAAGRAHGARSRRAGRGDLVGNAERRSRRIDRARYLTGDVGDVHAGRHPRRARKARPRPARRRSSRPSSATTCAASRT